MVYETKDRGVQLNPPTDEKMIRILNTLPDFAVYAGIRYKTTWGMGQCRRVRQLEGWIVAVRSNVQELIFDLISGKRVEQCGNSTHQFVWIAS